MTNSLMRWHLARDNRIQLAKFCEKNKVRITCSPNAYEVNGAHYFTNQYYFDNGASMTIELLHGDIWSHSVADCFQVIAYEWGTK